MDNLIYITITNAICLISLIGAIVVIAAFIIKKKVSPTGIILFLLFLAGMYLYIPMKLNTLGYAYQNPKMLQRAIKLSINPYEKRLCYKYLAEVYADDIFYQGIKDGNKAIEYMEQALKQQYSKYQDETYTLLYWYSIKGDGNKTFELAKYIKNANLPLRNIYIMQDNYKEALNTFKNEDNSIDNYLKADLYKKTGDIENSKKAHEIAQEQYNNILDNIKIRAKKLEYKEEAEKYKSVEKYKEWILAKRVELGFN